MRGLLCIGAAAALCVALLACGGPACGATLYVAQTHPEAADDNPGTEAQPLRTISAAVERVQPGDTVYVKEGVYREMVTWEEDWDDPQQRITLAAFPGHRPVVKGSDVLEGPWERLEGDRPIYFTPRDIYTQMLFCDQQPLQQIGWQGHPERIPEKRGGFVWQRQWVGRGLEDMRPGSFFYEDDEERLYVWLADGGDPAERVMEAAVRPTGFTLRGTWTLDGFDVKHIMDGLWPNEQAVAVIGKRCIVQNCRITHNEFVGLIVAGEDCIIRNNEIAHNGLMGFASNRGFRMLVEGNEFHNNAWRGDVVCLSAGHKWVMWRDSKFIGNWWRDEPAAALWLDINDCNILIAENRFDNCAIGVYFEISRWAVIVNNVFRNCGRAIWIYSSDALVAHNVLDGCGEGITISGYPRHCNYNQTTGEPSRACLMAVRNNLVVNNIIVDSPGSYVGITEDDGYGAGNFSDYNAFAWTLPIYHRTGHHINFMSSWHTLYARLPEWRIQRHYDTHSVIADRGLLRQVQTDPRYVVLGPHDVVAEAGFENRHAGDYRLRADSPLHGRGVRIPPVLNSAYVPGEGDEIVTRAWAPTLIADAPDPETARPVHGGEDGHYRLQPLPRLQRLVDLDAQPACSPGLNLRWRETGRYPQFDDSREPDVAADDEWMVFPDNRLEAPGFRRPMTAGGPDDGPGPWYARGGVHVHSGIAAVNMPPTRRRDAVAFQRVGTVAPDCEYILWGDMTAYSRDARVGAVASLYLAVGEELEPLGERATLTAAPEHRRGWITRDTRVRTGAADEDPLVGRDLYVVIAARVEGPDDIEGDQPVAFARWDNLVLLSGEPPA